MARVTSGAAVAASTRSAAMAIATLIVDQAAPTVQSPKRYCSSPETMASPSAPAGRPACRSAKLSASAGGGVLARSAPRPQAEPANTSARTTSRRTSTRRVPGEPVEIATDVVAAFAGDPVVDAAPSAEIVAPVNHG